MKVMITIMTLSVFFINSSICFGEWIFIEELGVKEHKISDEKHEFNIGGMRCGAEKTDFRRNKDDSVSEARQLYCWTSKDTYVATYVNCDFPHYSSQAFTMKKAGKHFLIGLTCGPNKK
jgi:hypothetical protein